MHATTYSSGSFSASSYYYDNVGSVEFRGYDILIMASSWDLRCRAICSHERLGVDRAIVVFFDEKDIFGSRDVSDQLIKRYFDQQDVPVTRITGISTNLDAVFMSIYESIIGEYRRIKRPMRILVDITTIPRYFGLGILAVLFRQGLLELCTVVYSEGRYPLPDDHRYVFREGEWTCVPVPGTIAVWQPQKSRLYFASLGFEGDKTLKVISRDDPDRIAVLFPTPGTIEEYSRTTWDKNKRLVSRYALSSSAIFRAPAGDAIRAWSTLDMNLFENAEVENVSYLCSGTKPHALALTLHSMVRNRGPVIYYRPESHRPCLIEPSGRFWRYDIRDLSRIATMS